MHRNPSRSCAKGCGLFAAATTFTLALRGAANCESSEDWVKSDPRYRSRADSANVWEGG